MGSKKVVFRLRSVSSMVIPAARTGTAPISSMPVTTSDQAKSGMRSMTSASVRMFHTVTTKLMDPTMEDVPARWRAKMAMSTDALGWPVKADRGG